MGTYKVTETKTRKTEGHEGHTWMLVEFRVVRGGPVFLTEDFCGPRSSDRAVGDDFDAELRDYWPKALAAGFNGDHTPDGSKPFYKQGVRVPQNPDSALPERDDSDPNGVLALSGVKALVGVEVEISDTAAVVDSGPEMGDRI